MRNEAVGVRQPPKTRPRHSELDRQDEAGDGDSIRSARGEGGPNPGEDSKDHVREHERQPRARAKRSGTIDPEEQIALAPMEYVPPSFTPDYKRLGQQALRAVWLKKVLLQIITKLAALTIAKASTDCKAIYRTRSSSRVSVAHEAQPRLLWSFPRSSCVSCFSLLEPLRQLLRHSRGGVDGLSHTQESRRRGLLP